MKTSELFGGPVRYPILAINGFFTFDESFLAVLALDGVGVNFRNWFDLGGKYTIQPTGIGCVAGHTLREDSSDNRILAYFKRNESLYMPISVVWSVLFYQINHPDKSILLRNGKANVFFVPGGSSRFCTVALYFEGGGCKAHAYEPNPKKPNGSSRLWYKGSRLFTKID